MIFYYLISLHLHLHLRTRAPFNTTSTFLKVHFITRDQPCSTSNALSYLIHRGALQCHPTQRNEHRLDALLQSKELFSPRSPLDAHHDHPSFVLLLIHWADSTKMHRHHDVRSQMPSGVVYDPTHLSTTTLVLFCAKLSLQHPCTNRTPPAGKSSLLWTVQFLQLHGVTTGHHCP